jgi:hypothetical protein
MLKWLNIWDYFMMILEDRRNIMELTDLDIQNLKN